ncbi:MAG: DUF6316 family protein [Pseudomonadales bacterium]
MRKTDGNDRETARFRSGDRVFSLNGRWYYQTREDDHGPFPSREAAERDLARYVEEMRFFDGVRKGGSDAASARKPGFGDFTLVDKD